MSYLGKIIATALWAISIMVLTTGTDPVNAPKLFLLGVFSFAAIGTLFNTKFLLPFSKIRIPLMLVLTFNIFSLFCILNSNAPLSQSFYGVYGRNNGYLLYFFLSLMFVACLTLRNLKDFKGIVIALLVAGLINVCYAVWVLIFGDFIPWNNPYGNLLGTFGNPNFAGAFFGIFSALPFSYLFNPRSTIRLRLLSLITLIFIIIGVVQTHAVQGKILFIFSFIFTFYLAIRNYFTSKLIQIGYLGVSCLLGLYSLLGALQIGPLTQLIYKESVSLRGQYWYAGWKTGISHPFFGVGFDSFGDWYRQSRRASALIRPGIDTVSNTAHNVFIDLFSFGGFPLLLTYLTLTIYVLSVIVKRLRKDEKFDPIFITISTAWLSYQLQSLISINQVGLAIWGWVLGAAAVAYSRVNSDSHAHEVQSGSKKIKQPESSIISPQFRAALMGGVGLLIAIPPMSSDIAWKNALDSRDIKKIENSLIPSYFRPPSTQKYNSAIALFETNGIKDLSHKYALLGVRYNPYNYDAWKNLYQIEKSTNEEKIQALRNMKELDPKNPDLKDLS